MITPRISDQIRLFLTTLFESGELVEIRPIEIWTDEIDQRRRTKVLSSERRWSTPDEIIGSSSQLFSLNVNGRANIFMGVCPRHRWQGSKKSDVCLSRCLWADMDGVTPEIARWQCHDARVPDPSMVVDSGSGVHLYWLLDSPASFCGMTERLRFEARLKSVHRRLRCDATSDVSRLLRLPGFWNMKNARSGAKPTRCELMLCRPWRRYRLDEFAHDRDEATVASDTIPRERLDFAAERRQPRQDGKSDEIDHIMSKLAEPATDRSRRDFHVVCELVRLGFQASEIWELVGARSKFATDGRRYFLTTLENARSATGQDS